VLISGSESQWPKHRKPRKPACSQVFVQLWRAADELAADILIIDTDAQSRSKPSSSRTKKQPISNGEVSKADRRARPRNPASQQDDSISLRQGQQNTRKTSEVVLRADTGGAAIAAGAAAKTKLAAYKSLSKAARSPKAISGDRLRSRDRLPAQACLVES
jgi:hypothetical protein